MQRPQSTVTGKHLRVSTALYRLVFITLVGLLILLSVKISWLLLARFQAPAIQPPLPIIASQSTPVTPQFSGLRLFPLPVQKVARKPHIQGIPETRLPLKVQGLFFAAQAQFNQVAMAVQGRPGVYLAGDRLPLSGQVELLAVEPQRILLSHNGRKEKLSLSHSLAQTTSALPAATPVATQPAAARPASRGADDRALYLAESAFARTVPDYRQRILKDPLFLSRYLSLRPHRENGQLQGYQLAPGRDGVLYKALQLKPDDVLVSLDQQPVSQPGKVLALLPRLGQASQLTLGLLRAGQPVTYTLYL